MPTVAVVVMPAVPVVVMMVVVAMVPVVPVVPVVMMMMVVVPASRHPYRPAMGRAAAPVMMTTPDPRNVVDHRRIDDSRLHR
jgi:hypothetical protein